MIADGIEYVVGFLEKGLEYQSPFGKASGGLFGTGFGKWQVWHLIVNNLGGTVLATS